MGNWELEIDVRFPVADFLSGTCFLGGGGGGGAGPAVSSFFVHPFSLAPFRILSSRFLFLVGFETPCLDAPGVGTDFILHTESSCSLKSECSRLLEHHHMVGTCWLRFLEHAGPDYRSPLRPRESAPARPTRYSTGCGAGHGHGRGTETDAGRVRYVIRSQNLKYRTCFAFLYLLWTNFTSS